MWGPELPYRRYSVPETVMRKVRLRLSSSSSSSDSSSKKIIRRPAARAKHASRYKYSTNTSTKGVQTSPHSNHCPINHPVNCLHGRPRRASSVPDLSSDVETSENRRPSSSRDKLLQLYNKHQCNGVPILVGTPSPILPSNCSATFHRYDVYSNSWSYTTTSSECTLGQTVSDRTTSTQDSTLSVQSSTPDGSTPTTNSTDRAARKMFLENSIFSPAGNFIAVHTESLLIHPIEIVESRENWNFAFSDSPESDTLIALPGFHKSIAINTDPPELCASFKIDKSTCAYGMFNDKFAQVKDSDIENEQMIDKSTYIEALNELCKSSPRLEKLENGLFKEIEKSSYVDIGINTERSTAVQTEELELAENPQKVPLPDHLTKNRAVFRIPNIEIYKGSTTESNCADDKSNNIAKDKVFVTKATSVNESSFKEEENLVVEKMCKYCGRKEIADINLDRKIELCAGKKPGINFQVPYERKLCTDVACSSCNYKDYPCVDRAVARFSAVPRSNSMLVNTSSIDYSSDSDLSLTDSLEDCADQPRGEHYNRPDTRHDCRLVRGEVNLEQQSNVKRYPKDNKAYAYFLSITGEQDMVKQCPFPDWLKVRLQRREEEIKKLFQIRLNKHQTIVYRRRKRTLKRIQENEDSNSNKENEKQKTKETTSLKYSDTLGKSEKYLNKNDVEKMPGSSERKNIDIKNKENSEIQIPEAEEKVAIKQVDSANSVNQQLHQARDNNYVHLSEVIKIEIENNLNTKITKEKQININENRTKDRTNIQTTEMVQSGAALNAKKIIMKTNIGNYLGETNIEPTLDGEVGGPGSTENTNKYQNLKENKVNVKAVFKKDENESYSFKQFKPLFQSKADDQTVAQILLSAMENDEKPLKEAEEVKPNNAKLPSTLTLHTNVKLGPSKKILSTKAFKVMDKEVRTETNVKSKNSVVSFVEPNIKVERSSNTVAPYLSTFVQTNESFLKENKLTEFADTENEVEDRTPTPTVEIPMVSSSVQTTETFIKNETPFIESESLIWSREQGTDAYAESPLPAKDNNEFVLDKNDPNEAACGRISVFVQTEQNIAAINEVKPLIIHNKNYDTKRIIHTEEREIKNYTSGKKPTTNTEKCRKHLTEFQKQFCTKDACGSHEDKSSQILELNAQPCTCHMCTLNKRASSRLEKHNEENRNTFQPTKRQANKSASGDKKNDTKPYHKHAGNRRAVNMANKFQKRFEVIPEERNSSTESIGEIQIAPVNYSPKNKFQGKSESAATDRNKSEVANIAEINSNISKKLIGNETSSVSAKKEDVCNLDVKSTQTGESKKSSVMFGRFKAIKKDPRITKESKMLGDGLEIMQQYKGRAALASAPVDAQEQLLTLSKGWINFYLLKENQELSDSNNDEVNQFQNDGLVQRGVSPIRIIKGSEINEQIEEFTVEIRATPEPFHTNDKAPILPNLNQQDIIRKRKSVKLQTLNNSICLPEIHTSSSSSTPENVNEKLEYVEGKTKKYHQPPLPIVSGRRKSSRHEIRMKRESVTSFQNIPRPEPLMRLAEEFKSNFEKGHATRGEMALSEHSVSSITSSTLILSESPSSIPEHKSQMLSNFHGTHLTQQQDSYCNPKGSSWTVTVAGNSGDNNQSPPDVEMRLTFSNKQSNKEITDKRLVNFNPKRSTHNRVVSKRKGRMIEGYPQSFQNLSGIAMQNSKAEFSQSIANKEISGIIDQDNCSQLSRRSKGSIDGSSDVTSICSDLQVTGLAITPESKPYVPTQSERDLVRRQRYKFTR